MSGEHRNYKRDTFYHVYNRGNRKQMVFYKEKDYQSFVDRMNRYQSFYDIDVNGYCLMPNHFHMIISSGRKPMEVSLFMHRFMTSFCMYENVSKQLVGRTFQGTYKAREIVGKEDLVRVVRYLRENPVKDGLVTESQYYKWLYLDEAL